MFFIAVKWDFLFCPPPPSRKSRLLAVDRLPVDSQGFLWTWSAEKSRWRNGRYSSIGKTDGSTRMGCSETRLQMAAKSAEIPFRSSTDRRSCYTAISFWRCRVLITGPSTLSKRWWHVSAYNSETVGWAWHFDPENRNKNVPAFNLLPSPMNLGRLTFCKSSSKSGI